MIQGTSSDSGKSFIVTGLCRIFADMGIRICPFKSQNMSNNAYITHNGLEMSRAQAVQAQAARLTPEIFMNPILLKPRHDKSSEIVLNGKVFDRPAEKNYYYHDFTQGSGLQAVRKALEYIQKNFDAIIIEGAGSPAEVNLNSHEIVNMRIAREANVPVILVADVDRGGALASVAGTLELLGNDRERVKGIIFNMFRGDIELFRSAVEWTENYTGIKVLGVVPYVHGVNISGEDSLSMRLHDGKISGPKISTGIVKFPGIANFSDFDYFTHEPDVQLIYIDENMSIKDFHDLDAIILPGTKNSVMSAKWLEASGLDVAIKNFHGFVFGICGGMQIMGREISDEQLRENNTFTKIDGLNLLPLTTSFNMADKVTRPVSGFYGSVHEKISGYEIHLGRSEYYYDRDFHALFTINGMPEGIANNNLKLAGTYLHGIFDNDNFRNMWLNEIRRTKNYDAREITNTRTVHENSYDYMAKILRENVNISEIESFLRS